LGAACAVDLAGRGWNVAINYTKSKKEADETYEKVKAKGVQAILVQADMGQDADCRKLAAETLKRGAASTAGQQRRHHQVPEPGRPRGRHARGLRPHPAGQRHRPLHDEPRRLSDHEEAMGRQQERGSIVNISSIAGVMGVGTSIPYAASKGALNTLTLSLARWFGRRCGSTRCAPGFIQTRWLLGALGQETTRS
jgi:3-oxoacyl-[acyl-carrier protein] reductase